MKKYLVTSIVLSVLLTGLVSAQTTSTGKNKIDILKQKVLDMKEKSAAEKDKMGQKIEDEKNKLKERLASTTEKLKEKKQEFKTAVEMRIGKKLDDKKDKIADGFEKSIQNLKDLVARIESRISKMVAAGTDTTSQKSLLETAKLKIFLAETELTNLENFLSQDIPTATSTQKTARKTLLQNIKTQSNKAKEAIKSAHKSIIDVVNSLKPGLSKQNISTSTQATTSTINQ